MLSTEKVKDDHLRRKAVIYVRQSTPDQVHFNLESQRRQYGLNELAALLGWREVEVIDEDMGRSGSSVANRSGFQRLVTSVCLGEVGAVFSLEASRLARNNRDWYQLVDVCGLVHTLIVDLDGVYDPCLLNDRLLLGMKGTMSEFELGLLRRRASEALLGMAERGELLTTVPIGYVRTTDNRCEKNPDLRVQQSIELVFRKFGELGSMRQVLLWFRQEKIPVPVTDHGVAAKVSWKLPVYHTIERILTNPAYAGAYAYGRTGSETTVVDGRAVITAGHRREMKDWRVLIRDHHECYISWEEFERNQQMIRENSTIKGAMVRGPTRGGPSLLSGLLRCGRCGRRLYVSYHGEGSGRAPRYGCVGARNSQGDGLCIAFSGLRVDRAVEEEIQEVVRPAGVEAAIKAAEEVAAAHAERADAMELAVEQARYEAERARRQYDAVDPDQRLVAAELERRWNAALTRLTEAEAARSLLPPEKPLRPGEREALLALGEDLPRVWCDPKTDMRLKKRIVRTLVEEIVVDIDEPRFRIEIAIHWVGGRHSLLSVRSNRIGQNRYATDPEVSDLVRQISKTTPDRHIAGILNRLGYKTGKGNAWTLSRIQRLRTAHGIPAFSLKRQQEEGWMNMAQAARQVGISPMSVQRLLRERILEGEQLAPCAPWVIHRSALEEERFKEAVAAIRTRRKRPLPTNPDQAMLNFEAVS